MALTHQAPAKRLTLASIAEMVGGKLVGDGDIEIQSVRGIEEAGEGDITFIDSERLLPLAERTTATALIVPETVADNFPQDRPHIIVKHPRLAFVKVLERLLPDERPEPGIHPTAIVAPSAHIGEGVTIAPYCVIEDDVIIGDGSVIGASSYVGARARVGKDCRFGHLVSVHHDVVIEDRVIIHSGAVIGADGFGYVLDGEQRRKIPQIGTVHIHSDVEIGANACIDRATFGATEVGEGTKIDNLVQVAHNVKIGKHCVICAQTGISGSTVIGNSVALGGQVGIGDHIHIGDGAVVGAQGGVISDIPPGVFYSGYPAGPHREKMRVEAACRRLPALLKEIRQMEKTIQQLQQQLQELQDRNR